MRTAKPLLIASLGLGLVLGATAQEKKVYRWVDKDGKVHISDQLPPEEVGRARKEYSASTGSLRNDVKTPLSPAEQAAAAEQARVEAAALAEAEKAKRIEQGMLTNYDNEQALQRAFNERTDLLKNTIVSLQASIQSRRAAVISGLNELAEAELRGDKLPEAKIKLLQSNQALVAGQTEQMARLNANYTALQSEFALTLEKYRTMKAEADAKRAALPDSL
ncbi:hypothetical protein GCM10010960_17270 [Arenimonas maotaiensis]|uniref:DUF4124 domain-containing protein n=1 Tax=Arenimonas maotaiensis TaxID=1446479 RepID=A0A917FNR2_9GAMM|nr:DUF4124 domain-containing protein [Arenimonas maotaiensis]GGF96162.1 hypothetical protein GCM10010960_17270 [Arenimonas maotaiensis]